MHFTFCGVVFLIPNRIAVETVCHVRYGFGFGGAASSGAWLLHALKILHTGTFISDPLPEMQSGDQQLQITPRQAGSQKRFINKTVSEQGSLT